MTELMNPQCCNRASAQTTARMVGPVTAGSAFNVSFPSLSKAFSGFHSTYPHRYYHWCW